MATIGQREITLVLRKGLNRKKGQLSNQIVDQIREAIGDARLNPGDRLPSSRILARELDVARGTVTIAIELLIAEGFLEARPGAGTFVSEAAISIRGSEPNRSRTFSAIPKSPIEPDVDLPARAAFDFRPCRPSLELFPISIWRRYLSLAGSAFPSADYSDPLGDVRLRQTIVDYLRRARGLKAGLNEIIITNGAIHAMHLLSTFFLKAGERVVVENPGYPLATQTFRFSGAEIIPCPVDHDGLIVEHLPSRLDDIRFVYTTPSHQFPTGSRLSLARRAALIDWAEKRGAIIVEDDYDGEFRYDVAPL
ncbi:MAG: PLP-dependent aminotransferase family protein, partial [Pseudomonadota bacterium]